jgi:DNA-binding transcriptional LysR family regulator
MDRLQAMTTFVTVVDTGGFSAAARKLDISTSVVSRIVTELEEHLGVGLLTRTTRLVRLTEAGSAYLEDCRRILGEIDSAERSAAGTRAARSAQRNGTRAVRQGICDADRARLSGAIS